MATALRKAEKRREAAEAVAARRHAELMVQRDAVARESALRERSDRFATESVRQVQALRDEVLGLRRENDRLRARCAELAAGTGRAEHEIEALRERVRVAEQIRDAALSRRSEPDEPTEAVRQEPGVRPLHPTPRRRRPIAIPGGVYGDSTAAAEHLLRSPGVCVLVDGYNVAKRAWPHLDLPAQRECCIEMLEDVTRRIGTDIRVVFDGADVVAASSRRRLIRVRFSPAGVTADDVIRAEVRQMAVDVPIVVTTSDQAIVSDVRTQGANVISTDAMLAVAGRTTSR